MQPIRNQSLHTVLIAVVFAASAALGHPARQDKPAVPKEVKAIAGVYTGQWTLFGVDKSGNVIKRAAWTDTLTVTNPKVEADRAFVTVSDEMTYEGGAP